MNRPVFVFTNNKGGVGKSTSATNVAFGILQTLRYAKVKDPRVLLIDTDGQAHATLLTTGRNDFNEHNSLHTVLMADQREIIPTFQRCLVQSHWDEGLIVMPGSHWLDETENRLFSANGAPYRLGEILKEVSFMFNAIVIDTRPSYTLLTKMAILAGTDAIIPIEPRYLENLSLNHAVREILDIRDGWKYNNIRISGILVTKMNRRIAGHVRLLESIEEHPTLGSLICGVIPSNEDISYSHAENLSVMQYNPKASSSKAYAELSLRLVRQMFQGGKS